MNFYAKMRTENHSRSKYLITHLSLVPQWSILSAVRSERFRGCFSESSFR